MSVDTRTRIVAATSELFRRQGMTGTGLKQITKDADAPFGSLYHFFPGGKAQLAEEVIRTSGKIYFDLVMAIFDASTDLLTGIENAFTGAAELLVETDYADACPIATIALEVASTDEPLRVATADVFADWIDRGAARIADSGLSEDARRRVIIGFITSLEGAFILCRALRSTEPLVAAGRTVWHAAQAELAAS
jgi:AcrR family transcriptional regulator